MLQCIASGCRHILGGNVERHHRVFAGCEALSETAIVAAAVLTLTLFHQSRIKNAPSI